MFKRPQDHEPDSETSQLGRILSPLRVYTWGPSAMSYLGVPIVIVVGRFSPPQKKGPGALLLTIHLCLPASNGGGPR